MKRGTHKGRDGKITQVYRKKWSIQIDKITKDKANGGSVNLPFHPSNVEIVKIKLDNDRKNLLARKDRSQSKTSKSDMKNID